MKKKLIVICGPTASGKSALALAIAQKFDGEIISCDSMQIYKKMDIGTAKPTPEELASVPHHMVDLLDPFADNCSCVSFADTAKKCIDAVIMKKRVPILCGGTGLYIDAVISDTEFSDTHADEGYRASLFALAAERGNSYIYDMLCKCDPESAAAMHENNLKRVIRALEIYHSTGITKSEWDKRSHNTPSAYEASVITLDFKDREKLYERINSRVDLMLESGLLEEARRLYDSGLNTANTTAAQAIGYKELFEYFDSGLTLDEAVEKLKRESRRYAKRQNTWFKRNRDAYRIYVDEADSFKNIVNNTVDYLTECGFCAIIHEK